MVVIVATALFSLVVCRWRPWDLFADAGFSNDFYDEQARSFLRGRLAVRPEVPGPEGFLIDGKTYLYYGPFLALARLPFAIFGDVFAGRLVRISMVLGFASLLTATYHLSEVARRGIAGGAVVTWWRTPLLVAAVACSPALFLSGWVSVYHETELWACAFAVWAAASGLRCIAAGATRRDAIIAGSAAAAATLVRAPVGIGATLGLAVIAHLLFWRRDERRPALTMVGVAGLGLVAHFAVNVAKFGSLFGLPGDKQLLSIQDPERAAWFAGNGGSFFGTRFLPTTVAQYLRPDTIRFDRLVPFIRFGPPAPQYGSYPLESTTPSASLTASATLLAIAAVVGVVVLVRRRAWAWLGVVAGGCVAAAPSFLIGFIGNRYLVDMLPALIVPAAAGLWVVRMPVARRTRRMAQAALVALVAWGTWCNVALATWVQNLKEPGFTAMRYDVDDVLFGDPAPGIVAFDPAAPVPRDGIVALDIIDGGSCRAVYIAEQGGWVPLERTNGLLRMSGTWSPAGGRQIVAASDTWSIEVDGGDGELRWSLVGQGIDPVTSEVREGTGEDPVRVTIVADPVTRELSVSADGRQVLFSFAVPPGQLQPGVGFRLDDDPGDSLCRQLLDRR